MCRKNLVNIVRSKDDNLAILAPITRGNLAQQPISCGKLRISVEGELRSIDRAPSTRPPSSRTGSWGDAHNFSNKYHFDLFYVFLKKGKKKAEKKRSKAAEGSAEDLAVSRSYVRIYETKFCETA